jgi:membrane protease YdiL (CAAX protease family)
MAINSTDLFSKVTPTTLVGRIIQFPLIRIIIVSIFLAPAFVFHLFIKEYIKTLPELYNPWLLYIEFIIFIVLLILSYRLYSKYIEKRTAIELSRAGLIGEMGRGMLIGGSLMTGTVAVLLITGCYRFGVYNGITPLLNGIFLLGVSAFVEELFARVIFFKLIEEYFGSWAAIAVMAILFGLTHLGNPNATIIAALAIMLETGLLLGAAYMLTRRIWLIWGIHLAWNYFQSTVFGVNVSGITLDSVVTPEITGPVWLTGGEFGVEASLPAVILCLIAGVIILKLAIAKGRLVKPAWRRSKMELQ